MFNDFRKFLLRDNVLGTAIGLVVGAAFSQIIRSFINNLISPFVGIILNRFDFSKAKFQVGTIVVNYGIFINDLINFLIIAFIVFLIIRMITKTVGKDTPDSSLSELKEIRKILSYQTIQHDKELKQKRQDSFKDNYGAYYKSDDNYHR